MGHHSVTDTRFVTVRSGRVAYSDSDPDAALPGTPLVFLHGGSASRRVFRAQVADDFGPRRVLAPDLPGHGGSDDASDPERAYTIPGFARAVVEFLGALGLRRAVVVGWSMGGAVGLELVQCSTVVAALVTTGMPPVDAGELDRAFRPEPALAHARGEHLTAGQAAELAELITTSPAPAGVVDDILRTDGRARRIVFSAGSLRREGTRALTADPPVPFAIVDGRDDPSIDREYVGSIPLTSLWRSGPVLVDGTGHAPFLEKPADYDELIRRFLRDNDL